jgi:hypothetical protein
MDQLDKAMTKAVNQIPDQASQISPGFTLPVTENAFNNLLVLNLSPSNPVQKPVTKITTSGIKIDFEVYGQPVSMSGTPTVVDGKLTVTNAQIGGLASLVLSPEELTTQLNKHLADAQQTRLKRPIHSVQLKNGQMDITFG